MNCKLALIGFGEAASTFANNGEAWPHARAFDVITSKLVFAANPAATARDAVSQATAILSLVTADQALPAAQQCAPFLARDALWFDMNSVSPQSKLAAAGVIEEAGGRYVDVAVMAPVQPKARAVPLLLSGPHREAGEAVLASLGFSDIQLLDGPVGAASSVKMIRSIMVKGLEALSAECVLAADAAGVLDEVVKSLDASWTEEDWTSRADYNLGRMIVHGLRRAAEMEEVVKTIEHLGTGAQMTRATVERQRAIGGLKLKHPPAGLGAKLRLLAQGSQEKAA